MKHCILLFLFALNLLLSACGSDKAPVKNPVDSLKTQEAPQPDSAANIGGDSAKGTTSGPNEGNGDESVAKGTFRGKVTFVSPYCGGAAPSKEILEEMRRPRPLEQYEFFLKGGTRNNGGPVLHRFRTDGAGNFNISLPPGNFCLCAREQTLSAAFHPELYEFEAMLTDETAYTTWWKECRYSFQIRSGATVEKNLHFEVNCMTQSICPQIKNQMANRLP